MISRSSSLMSSANVARGALSRKTKVLIRQACQIVGLKLGGELAAATGEHGEVVGAIVLIGISGAMAMGWLLRGRGSTGLSSQEIAALTSSATFFSAAGVHSMSAYDTGHTSPSSRLAESWKPRVE
jgi:hypothetical protein